MNLSLPDVDFSEFNPDQRPERSDAIANREAILAAAARLIAEKGADAVHMAEIAQEAGVGKGTLYRRFASKAELCLALLDSQMLTFQNEVLEGMRQMSAEGKPKLEQLDHFLTSLVLFTDEHSQLLCEVQRAGLLTDEINQQRPYFWQHMTVSGLLRAAAATGELPSGLDVTYFSDAILSTLRADIFRFQRQARGFTLERIRDGLLSLVRGLT